MFSTRKSKAAAAVDEELSVGGVGNGCGVRALLGGSSGLLSLDGQSLALPSPSEQDRSQRHQKQQTEQDPPVAVDRGLALSSSAAVAAAEEGLLGAAPMPAAPPSLSSGSGLGGRSLHLSFSDDEDEMSSIHSSSAYRYSTSASPHGGLGPYGSTRLKIIGSLRLVDSSATTDQPQDDCKDPPGNNHNNVGVPSPRSYSNPSPTSHTDSFPGLMLMDQVTRADTKDTAQSGSLLDGGTPGDGPTKKKSAKKGTSSGGRPRRRTCLPLWIQRAPHWLKIALLASAFLVLLAVVLVAVTVSLAVRQQQQPESSNRAQDGDDTDQAGSLPPTFPSTNSSGPSRNATQGDHVSNATTTPNATTNYGNPYLTTFAVTGGRYPESLAQRVPDLLPGLAKNMSDDDAPILLLAHLGDWNSPSITQCDWEAYQDVADLFATSPVPVHFVPGDNEYNDCGDLQDQAIANWRQTLVNYETSRWTPPYAATEVRQAALPENFYFLYHRIVFVGLNVVSGSVHNQTEWDQRLKLDLAWLDQAYKTTRPTTTSNSTSANSNSTTSEGEGARAMVVFAHSSPTKNVNAAFFDPFFRRVFTNYSDVKVVLLHRNDPGFEFEYSPQYGGIPNLDVISVLGSSWPPARVQIDLTPITDGTESASSVGVVASQEVWFPKASAGGD